MNAAWAEYERYEKELFDKGVEKGVEQGVGTGIGKGQARSILRVLQARGLSITDELRQRILSCTDSTQLDLWTDRAVTATRAEDIFAVG